MLGADKYSGSLKVEKALWEHGCTPLVAMGCTEIELEEMDVSVLPWTDSIGTAIDALASVDAPAADSCPAKATGGEAAQVTVESSSGVAAAAAPVEEAAAAAPVPVLVPMGAAARAEPSNSSPPIRDKTQPIPDSPTAPGGVTPVLPTEVADAVAAMMQQLALISAAETTAERDAQYDLLAKMLEATTGAAASPPEVSHADDSSPAPHA